MAVSVPFSTTRTNHGLIIKVGGQAVGAISKWDVGHSRTATPVFEFGQVTTGGGGDVPAGVGEAFEFVPGNVSDTKIDIGRMDIYTNLFENAFGSDDLTMLSNQSQAIQLVEAWAVPGGALQFSLIYHGVWFTRIGRNHSATDGRLVMVNASCVYTRVTKAPA